MTVPPRQPYAGELVFTAFIAASFRTPSRRALEFGTWLTVLTLMIAWRESFPRSLAVPVRFHDTIRSWRHVRRHKWVNRFCAR